MNKDQVKEIFDNFQKQKILIVGDVMVDSYMMGNVTRISPEAPVPILSANKKENRIGGAANVAINIQALGATPILCSTIGEDETGTTFMELISKQSISNNGIVIDKKRTTTKKTRIIAHNQQLIRIDEENIQDIDENVTNKLIKKIDTTILNEKINGIILQDYNKGVLTKQIIDYLIKLAKNNNVPILVDPKKTNFNYFKNITLFKPNLRELSESTYIESVKDIELLKNIIKKILIEKNIEIILLTLSENGLLICTKNECHHIPAEIRDIADVSGAGDTVISTASLCLASRLNIYDIAYISNLAGGIVCEKSGVVPVNKEKLIKELIANSQ